VPAASTLAWELDPLLTSVISVSFQWDCSGEPTENQNLTEIRKGTKLFGLLPVHVRLSQRPLLHRILWDLSGFVSAESGAGSASVPSTFVLEREGSCGLRNTTEQVPFSLWRALEPSLAAGDWCFKKMMKGSDAEYRFTGDISPPGVRCLTFPLVSVSPSRGVCSASDSRWERGTGFGSLRGLQYFVLLTAV